MSVASVVVVDKAKSARAHSDAARAYFNLEKYKEAIAELEQAYLDKSDPAYLFDIAECHRMLGAGAEAMRFYRRFLQDAQNHPNRAKAEQALAELERTAATTPPPSSAPAAPVTPPPSLPSWPPASATAASGSGPAAAASSSGPASVPAAVPPAEQPGGPVVVAAQAEPAPARAPVYAHWWFWALVGGVVAGGAVLGLALASPASRPSCPAGVVCR